MGCTNNFPDEWVELMFEQLNDLVDNPTGIWADFNIVYRMWIIMRTFIRQGLICEEDYPDEPQASDYPDLSSAATLTDLLCEVEYHCGATVDIGYD